MFPEEYAKNAKRSRNRRATTWAQSAKKEQEGDANIGYNDFYAKEGIASQSRTISLTYDDFKEVNYLQDMLKESKSKNPNVTIKDFVFDEKEYPLIEIGNEEYREYDPPVIDIGTKYISRFNEFFDLLAKSSTEKSVESPCTMRSVIQYLEKNTHKTQKEEKESLVSLEVIKKNTTAQDTALFDSEKVDAEMIVDPTSRDYLMKNGRNYKANGTGLPNAICVTKSFIVVGMSKSQILFFPNPTLSPDAESPESSEPFVVGSPDNGSGVGSVLSLSCDLNDSFVVAGYSTGDMEMISLDKRASVRMMSDIHDTAVVFVRVLSSSAVFSVDYDGNVNLTTLTRTLFGANTNTTRVLDGAQYGQIVDISVIPFSVTVRSAACEHQAMTVDLVALCAEKCTVIMAVDSAGATVLFTLERAQQDVSERSRYFEAKTRYVQNYVSSAWCRDANAFQFVQCENDRLGVWEVKVRVVRRRDV